MPTNTDRILSYLPHTFLTTGRDTVLYAVADPFGNELLQGMNSLAEILLSHWVDFADKGAESIDDLAELAKLYGLAPLREEDLKTFRAEVVSPGKYVRSHTTYKDSLESVEEFREHLKHYVRTFLEGTVTVQGVLRIAAEALGLRIADEPEDLDRWWTRRRDEIVIVEPRDDDAADQLRFERRLARGAPERPAQVIGTVNLSSGIDLTGPAILRLRFDGVDQDEIDLADGLALPGHLSLQQIAEKINEGPRPEIATAERGRLKLVAPQIGPLTTLEMVGGPNDVAPRLLGLAPRTFHGTAATSAELVGAVDLRGGVDLSVDHFLRFEIDGHVAEIDCGESNASLTDLKGTINQAFQAFGAVASDDGKHLILTSPKKGFNSTVSVQAPAAQNAAPRILGVSTAFKSGRNEQPARFTSPRDLRSGIDLSERANVQLRIDEGPSVTINCAGADPARTTRIEIATAINDALGAEIASVTERSISLTSPTAGLSSAILFESAPVGDAASEIFGVESLVFESRPPAKARLASHPVLTESGGFNPWAQNILSLAVDGGAPIEINLRRAAKPFPKFSKVSTDDFVEGYESVILDDLVELINQAVNADIAATDGTRLLLNSPTVGGASSLQINSLERTRGTRFVTRATVTDEATSAIFGFTAEAARGAGATAAWLNGDRDLSQTVDLTKRRLLRVKIDGYPAAEVDCAGGRPRATSSEEIVKHINDVLGQIAPELSNIAAADGKHLTLTSPSKGEESVIALEAPRAALDKLLGAEPGSFHGEDAIAVRFVSPVDLSGGVDLDPNAALNLGFDEHGPVEISLAGPAPNHHSLLDITTKINTILNANIAGTDGKHIVLTSPKKGVDSKLDFAVPTGQDATQAIFGIAAPRSYQGKAAAPARIFGLRNLSADTDLRALRFLNVAVDGRPARDIDCAANAEKPHAAKLVEVVDSINSEVKKAGVTKNVATHDGTRLILTSPTLGAKSQLAVQAYVAGDAREAVFGQVDAVTSGAAATPASITGKITLLAPVNLARRSLLRLTVDGARPRDIDVAGKDPAKTFLDEIVASINRVFPNLASATDDDHLRLTSQIPGEESQLSVLPLRYLEISEYQPQLRYLLNSDYAAPSRPLPLLSVRHGDDWRVQNDGAADTRADIRIKAPQGTVGPTIVNGGVGWSARLFTLIDVGETAHLSCDEEGHLLAEITSAKGVARAVDSSEILVGPLGSQAWVPTRGEWIMVGEMGEPAALQLNNPTAAAIVLLRAQHPDDLISVSVTESEPNDSPPSVPDGEIVNLVGRVVADQTGFQLVDQNASPISQLRAGPKINLKAKVGRVVRVIGSLHEGTPPLMIVQSMARMFDVTIERRLPGSLPETYSGVTIGEGVADQDALVLRINADSRTSHASTVVRAFELNKANILSLPRGQTTFRYLDCLGARFDQARFDHARFPDGICGERGIFDVSRFQVPAERVNPVFTSEPISDPPVGIDFRWQNFQPGTFTVNLPADLLPRFGARFNDARFSQTREGAEVFAGAVAEPRDDPKFLVKLITDRGSHFVTADVVGTVPLGWTAVPMPFRKPQFLSLGKSDQAARLYLSEEGLNGFIKLEAKTEGPWGNEIAVSARPTKQSAIYDVSVIYCGGCFENARTIVMGQPLAELGQALIQPGPIGVLQAKAAGVKAAITRDRAEYEELSNT